MKTVFYEEPALLKSCDNILQEIQKTDLNESVKSKISKGEVSPFMLKELDFNDDSKKLIFRYSLSNPKNRLSSTPYGFKYNAHASLFGASNADSNLNHLFNTSTKAIEDALNNSSFNQYGYRILFSFSQSISVSLFKYGLISQIENLPKDGANLVWGETNTNSVYLEVLLKDTTSKQVRIPLREIASKECVWNRIKSKLGYNLNYGDILNIVIEDVNYDISCTNRETFKNTKFTVAPDQDLEFMTSIIPYHFHLISGYNLLQVIKLYLLFLVFNVDAQKINIFYNFIKLLYNNPNVYPRKIPRSAESRMALQKLIDLFDDKSFILHESTMKIYKNRDNLFRGIDSLNFPNYYENYHNQTYDWFDSDFLFWIYKNVF